MLNSPNCFVNFISSEIKSFCFLQSTALLETKIALSNFIVSVSLTCSMDLQSSDGRSMFLKYVTSYVTKMKDQSKTIAKVLIFIIYVDDLYIVTLFYTIFC